MSCRVGEPRKLLPTFDGRWWSLLNIWKSRMCSLVFNIWKSGSKNSSLAFFVTYFTFGDIMMFCFAAGYIVCVYFGAYLCRANMGSGVSYESTVNSFMRQLNSARKFSLDDLQ